MGDKPLNRNAYCLQHLLLALLLVWSGLGADSVAIGEPWLSTRFAQNCASCHAPGRKNLRPVDRRCTLSCQGCHVNPNGGGIRSFYGKWTEDRWLYSFRNTKFLKNELAVLPTPRQVYGRDLKKQKKKDRKRAKRTRKAPKIGFPLVERNIVKREPLYDRRDGLEFITSKSRQEFEYQIPQKDPYRLMDLTKVDGGGDIRYQVTKFKLTGDDKARWQSFLMAGDFGVRWRPLYRNLHLVYESRILGTPAEVPLDSTLTTSLFSRSIYVMVDDLPFNVFVMGGYYRPLVGNFVADHTAIAQEMTSYAMTGNVNNYSLIFNAVSVGTAPNVPYGNFHLINGKLNDPDDKTKGFATNLGLRFVTLGASVNYSYFRTTDKRKDVVGTTTQTELHSIHGAAMFGRIIAGIEGVSITRDVNTQDFRQGGVWTLDTMVRLWRENYITANFATANTTTQLKPGSANQLKAGIKSFPIPGTELVLLLEQRSEKEMGAKQIKLDGYSGQFHVFF